MGVLKLRESITNSLVICSLPCQSCDKMTANSSSQTALDIAKFWGHRHISNLLSRTDDSCQRVLQGSDLCQYENYFSKEMLDRLSAKRTDEVWLKARQKAPDTIYLMFSNLNPMICISKGGDKVEVVHS